MSTNASSPLAPVIAVTHGGGPLPVLGDPSQAEVARSLRTKVPPLLSKSKAIILVTAHWEEDVTTVSSAAKHNLLYDYHGFPREAYELRYDAPGSPEVARMVLEALKKAGIEGMEDKERGWDHGVFIPLSLIAPEATIPVIQLSVLSSQSPSALYALGRALSSLRAQNVAIIGSGSASFHNLRLLFSGYPSTPEFQSLHERWSRTLDEAISEKDVEERGKLLEGWKRWEGSSTMHPRGRTEHFSPLIVCAGAGGEGVAGKWDDEMGGVRMGSWYWA